MPFAIKPQTSILELLQSERLIAAHTIQRTALILGKLNTTQFCRQLPATFSPNTGTPIQGSNLPWLEECHFF